MTKAEREKIEKHFDELNDIASGLNPHIPDEIKAAMKAAYVAGAEYALDTHPHWICVEDELPKEDGEYFTFLYNSGIRVTDFLQGKWQMFGKEPQDGMDVAYWMPIPSVHHLADDSTEERR